MSASAHWRPVPEKPEGEWVPYRLHRLVAERYGEYDGSMAETFELDEDHIVYLEGLRDSGIDGAAELIEAIRKHERIEIEITR